MPSYKVDRAESDIRREMTELFRSVKDPRVSGSGMLSVVRVEVSGDFGLAKIYVSAMDGPDAAKSAVAGLKSASAYLRGELARRLSLRKMPELRFIADNSIGHSAHIARVLGEISEKRESRGAEGEADGDADAGADR